MRPRGNSLIHDHLRIAARVGLLGSLVGLLAFLACAAPARSLAAGPSFEWIQQSPASVPTARTYPSSAEAPGGGVLLFGGGVTTNGPGGETRAQRHLDLE